MEILDHSLFRVTRDTDYDVSDAASDMLQAVEEELRRRRFGEVVRLEIDAGMSEALRDQLTVALGASEDEVYEIDGLIDLGDLWDVVGISGHDDLRYPPFTPVTPPRLLFDEEGKEANLFAAIRAGDILVHHPYDSFATTVERFVKQAVSDPDVLAIKQTVYRTSADSPLVPGLIEAAERGKQAVCLVELKARFERTPTSAGRRSSSRPASTSSTGSRRSRRMSSACSSSVARAAASALRPHRDRQLQPEDGADLHRSGSSRRIRRSAPTSPRCSTR